MTALEHRCTICDKAVVIAPYAAWPERCPYCHATPLRTRALLEMTTTRTGQAAEEATP